MKRKKIIIAVFVLVIAVLVGVVVINRTQGSKKDYEESAKLLSTTPSPKADIADSNQLDVKDVEETPEAEKKEVAVTQHILLDVPFTSQSPFAEWDNPLQQDGCEEASVLMAISWAKGESVLGKQEAKDKMLAISDWQIQNYGNATDTSTKDTLERIINGYYDWQKASLATIESPQEIINELIEGNLVILPMDGQKLGNPNFTEPGPERHMLVVKGYDPDKLEFITNDPGTRQGEHYRYPVNVLWSAIRDYPTGDHEPITEIIKNMIVVSR